MVDVGMESMSIDKEESRLREVMAHRKARVPSGLYALSNPGQLFMLQDRERHILDLLKNEGGGFLDGGRILEVGCGTGGWIRDLIRWGANPCNITGVDIVQENVAEARRLSPGDVCVQHGNATSLQFEDHAFDLVIQATVFTSILDPSIRRQLALEMLRVLKPDGMILWYDFHTNNPWNADVHGVTRRDICALFPQCRIRLRRVTLAPPLARTVAPISWVGSHLLNLIPILRTHYLGTIRKVRSHE